MERALQTGKKKEEGVAKLMWPKARVRVRVRVMGPAKCKSRMSDYGISLSL
jgi:hypothetical protein